MADGNSLIVAAPPAVYGAIAGVMSDLADAGGIGKDRKASGGGPSFSFRGIDDVYNALAPILSKHRLVIVPRCLSRTVVERESNQGKAVFYVTVEADFVLTSADDGSCIVARTFGEAMDSSDKATNKAMSAAYKYMAMQTFCIPTEGDNDADATSHEAQPARAPPDAAEVRACFLEIDGADGPAALQAWGSANGERIGKLTERGQSAVREHFKGKLAALKPKPDATPFDDARAAA